MKLSIKKFTTILLTIVMILCVGRPAFAFVTSDYCMEPEEVAFLKLINDYRAQNGLNPLTATQTISAAAEYHSIDMATYNYFSHTLVGPDHLVGTADDYSWSQNMTDFGYNYNTYRGENIAAGYINAADVFVGWKNSAGHNANMLTPQYTAIGIGRYYGANTTYAYYWTTDFGGNVDAPAVICGVTPTPTTSVASPTPTRALTGTPVPTVIPTRTPTPLPTSTPTPTPGQTDVIPPTVTVTSPLNNSTVTRKSTVIIQATASDNIGVVKVDFLLNNKLKCSSLLPPYSCVWKVPAKAGTAYSITTKAYDQAGNTATSTISVTAR